MLFTFDKDAHSLDGDRESLVYSAALKFQIRLLDAGAPCTLQDGESLKVVVKPGGKFDSGAELFAETFTAADFVEATSLLQRIVSLLTVPMAAAMKDNGNSADDLPALKVNLAVGYLASNAVPASWSAPLALTIINTPGRDSDGTPQGFPAAADAWMAQPCTALIGSGPRSLDAVPTAGGALQTGNVRSAVVNNLFTVWQLIDGTDAEDVSAGVVRPDDYDDTTNARVWQQIL